MATIKEILHAESGNTSRIYLYREGLFLKAYERSAYLWTRDVCRYEVKSRYVKSAGAEVMSIGFPASVLEQKLAGRGYAKDGDNVTVEAVGGGAAFDEAAYRQWRDDCGSAASMAARVGGDAGTLDKDSIAARVMEFPLESRSPMECMIFLSELKKLCRTAVADGGDIH